jgi:hypothetical protein
MSTRKIYTKESTMIRFLLACALLMVLSVPASARNVVNWQCGTVGVDLEVNKSTKPYSYNVWFEQTDLKGGINFKWYPTCNKNFGNGCAYLNGKLCKEIEYL